MNFRNDMSRQLSRAAVLLVGTWPSLGPHTQRVRRGLALMLAAALLGGCVTTTKGRLPQPASEELRMQAQINLARGYLSKRDFERAREPVERALAMDSRSAEALVLLAAVEQGEGESGLAEATYTKVRRMHPTNPQVLTNYGGFLLSQGRTDEALPLLRIAAEDNTYYLRSQAFEYLGMAELAQNNRQAAQAAFERALGLNKEQANSVLELANIKHEAGATIEAQQLYKQYRRVGEATPRSLCLGMRISAAAGDTDGQASAKLALKNLFPNSAQARQCTQTGANTKTNNKTSAKS